MHFLQRSILDPLKSQNHHVAPLYYGYIKVTGYSHVLNTGHQHTSSSQNRWPISGLPSLHHLAAFDSWPLLEPHFFLTHNPPTHTTVSLHYYPVQSVFFMVLSRFRSTSCTFVSVLWLHHLCLIRSKFLGTSQTPHTHLARDWLQAFPCHR